MIKGCFVVWGRDETLKLYILFSIKTSMFSYQWNGKNWRFQIYSLFNIQNAQHLIQPYPFRRRHFKVNIIGPKVLILHILFHRNIYVTHKIHAYTKNISTVYHLIGNICRQCCRLAQVDWIADWIKMDLMKCVWVKYDVGI